MANKTFNDASYARKAMADGDTISCQTGDTVAGAQFAMKGSNLKTYLKTYFDTLYHPLMGSSDDLAEGSTNLYLTAAERTAIATNSAKVSNQQLTGDVTTPSASSGATTISNSAVTGPKIQSGAVDNTKMASNAIAAANIQDGAVTAPGKIGASGTPSSSTYLRGDGAWATPPLSGGGPQAWMYALSDETTDLTTGVKVTSRVPYGGTLSQVRVTLTTAGSSSTVVRATHAASNMVADMTLPASDKSTTTTTITVPTMVDDAELVFSIQTAGTGAKGLKIHMLVTPS